MNVDDSERMAAVRSRLYESYATTHAGISNAAGANIVYRRDIRPYLPRNDGATILDVGCGQGALVQLLLDDGYDASGVDVSAEQVALAHQAGVPSVVLGDFKDVLGAESGNLHAVVATDLLEHLTKDEVLSLFDAVHHALRPGGCFVARTPNAVSPFSGNIQHGDFTHETNFTPRSIAQIAGATGYSQVDVRPCPPVAHGFPSRARAVAWRPFSAAIKMAIMAETGQRDGLVVTQNMTFVAQRSSD
jgi:2-polyprenyl-3-methyl-5-hydroxy-6-metoxy-1,4-benzoquinol methylase